MKITPAIQSFDNKSALQSAAADYVEYNLQDALSRRGSAVFMGAGGSTPGPVYQQLSKRNLSWSSVRVGLTDERWVDEDHPGSNAALMQRTLLQNHAAKAEFVGMKTPDDNPFDAVEEVADAYMEAVFCDVMLLGMGPDAHTLSWFPGARGLDLALDPLNPSPVAAIEANKSEVTGDNLLRMTLTLPCVAEARAVLLLITGAEKLKIYEAAAADTPVARMRRAAGQALTVFYAD